MDDIVLRGMAKWPNVPAVYGWLELNRRGQWLIKGEAITNPTVSSFIARNYERDGAGRWFFQNGPQRVFVGLDYTPFVYRAVEADDRSLELETQTGARAASVLGAWLDENGVLLVQTDRGVGVIHDHDLERIARTFSDAQGRSINESALEDLLERVQRGGAAELWMKYRGALAKVERIRVHDVPGRFRFVASPGAPEGHPECA